MNYIRPGAIVLFVIFFVGIQCQCAFCDSYNEMDVLGLFYKDKDLVVTPTRNPKSVSYVAENITVIASQQIEDMNAHTLADVLRNVPGIYINYSQDFGAHSIISIQGSEDRHVVVILDGIRWNFLSSGAAEINSIPVGIIDRIEVIKGPASSTWGSSLGGVINIITKNYGNRKAPNGTIIASYGDRNTVDAWGDVAGKAGPVGYYLYAGHQSSDGLENDRYFHNNNIYSKLGIPIGDHANIQITGGYTAPEAKLGDFPDEDITSETENREYFATAAIDASISKYLSFDASLHHLDREFLLENNALGIGMVGNEDDTFLDQSFDDRITSGTGKFVWDAGRHTIILGTDLYHGNLDQTLYAGELLQAYGVPAETNTTTDISNYAFFLNDTIIINKWSFTPGIRFDDNSVSGSFWSPSLGATYQLDEKTLFRSAIARGFTSPPLSYTQGGGLFLDPNSDLEPEEVWSIQIGMETHAARYLWLKGTAFYHDLENAFERELYGGGPPNYNDIGVNDGQIIRKGVELEFETIPIFDISIWGGVSYVNIDNEKNSEESENYTFDIALKYNDNKSVSINLFGHYIFQDIDEYYGSNFNNIIWDANFSKSIIRDKFFSIDLFLSIHNIFNGDQYFQQNNPNPNRWIEGGFRIEV